MKYFWHATTLLACILLFSYYKLLIITKYDYQYFNYPKFYTLQIANNINDHDMFQITEAALEWQNVSKKLLTFTVQRVNVTEMNDNILFTNITAEMPAIIELDDFGKKRVLAYYESRSLPTIFIVNNRIPYYDYKKVILHELGHAFGLNHTLTENTIMYATSDKSSDSLSENDIQQFCKLHNC